MNYVSSLAELYKERTLYSTPDMFSPPSERRPHVIRFELTTGCKWGKCSYCQGFDGVRPRTKCLKEFRSHVDAVWERTGFDVRHNLRRLFIGSNALEVKTNTLAEAIDYTRFRFLQHTDRVPSRIGTYATTKSIMEKGTSDLRDVRFINCRLGLDLIYWGVESGSTKLLDYVSKGCTQKDILRAADALNDANMQSSVMIMPGLGGIKFYDEHIEDTIKVLNRISPRYLTFMGVNAAPKSRYAKLMASEVATGTNRPLTDAELATQMIEMISAMPTYRTKVGCFKPNIDAVSHNSLTFDAVELCNALDRDRLVEKLRMKQSHPKQRQKLGRRR